MPAKSAKGTFRSVGNRENIASAPANGIPGNTGTDLGECKRIPDDDDISPNAYGKRWNTR